jgi:hypothetical protein
VVVTASRWTLTRTLFWVWVLVLQMCEAERVSFINALCEYYEAHWAAERIV